ncbi:MAG: toprim domain-containing protein [Armatimonadota bacterium]|nr:toprim domain-containing protein [Armatimonadota bacterium]
MATILSQAEALLGPAVRVYPARGWAEFWCPFHDDARRQGRRGRPNLGVSLVDGHWRCLRCGAAGPSLAALARALGQDFSLEKRADSPLPPPPPRPIARLEEALGIARWALWNAPAAAAARAYLEARGIPEAIARAYGLGYGPAAPRVRAETLAAAREAGLVRKDGLWRWAGALVFPDPPVGPRAIQIRRVRAEPAGPKYQSWGRLERPYGAWRIRPGTRLLIAAEGVFDALALAAALEAEGLFPEAVPVATWGSSPSRAVLEALREWPRELWLIPDPDEAGEAWARRIRQERGKQLTRVLRPPEGLDPDEAIRAGWRPWKGGER